MPCHATPRHAIPRHAMPCHPNADKNYQLLINVMPCHATPRHANQTQTWNKGCTAWPRRKKKTSECRARRTRCSTRTGPIEAWEEEEQRSGAATSTLPRAAATTVSPTPCTAGRTSNGPSPRGRAAWRSSAMRYRRGVSCFVRVLGGLGVGGGGLGVFSWRRAGPGRAGPPGLGFITILLDFWVFRPACMCRFGTLSSELNIETFEVLIFCSRFPPPHALPSPSPVFAVQASLGGEGNPGPISRAAGIFLEAEAGRGAPGAFVVLPVGIKPTLATLTFLFIYWKTPLIDPSAALNVKRQLCGR